MYFASQYVAQFPVNFSIRQLRFGCIEPAMKHITTEINKYLRQEQKTRQNILAIVFVVAWLGNSPQRVLFSHGKTNNQISV